MITEKDTIKCEAIFNDERTHRYLWKRVWDKEKPLATVIMLNPCHSDNIITDTTTSLVVNNVAKLKDYGGVEIVNLFSMLTTKLDFRKNTIDELNDSENNSYIKRAAEESKAVILAWGRSADSNQSIADRATEVINVLMPYKDKLYIISDGERAGVHPLTPSVRARWVLDKVTIEEPKK